jgi:hypothetical protein
MYNFIWCAYIDVHVICIETNANKKRILQLRHNGRKKPKCFIYIYIYYNEFPRDEQPVDFDNEEDELCPSRFRGTDDRHRSLDDGHLSHSDCKH